MFDPGIEKPDFPVHSTRGSFMAKCHALYDGHTLEEIRYVLTPERFTALELVFFKGMSQIQAAKHLNIGQEAVGSRLKIAAKSMEKWKKWKTEKGAK
jgi:hypothetical protein